MITKLFVVTGLLVMVLCAYSAVAQSGSDRPVKEKSINIKYFGQSAFLITTSSGTRIIIDPVDFRGYSMPPDLMADIVTVSHEAKDHTNKAVESINSTVFYGAYNEPKKFIDIDTTIGDVRLYSVLSYHDSEHYRINGIFVYEFDGIRLAQLGDLGTTLTSEQVEAIGEIDILMIPVGGYYTIGIEEADSVINQLNVKRLVLPMHYKTEAFDGPPNTAGAFLKGKDNVRMLETNAMLVDLSETDVKREYVQLQY